MKLIENPFWFSIFTLTVVFDQVVLGDLELNGFFTSKKSKCDISNGEWVHDDLYHRYNPSQCPFISDEFNCQKSDRSNTSYLKYRWQPYDCDLPRFYDYKHGFLKIMERKKIMFVGDWWSLNMWQSLACLIHTSAIPQAANNYTLTNSGDIRNFTIPSRGFSLSFHDLSRTRPLFADVVEEPGLRRVLKLDSVGDNGEIWKQQDVLVFNIWHAWVHPHERWFYNVRYIENTLHFRDRLEAYIGVVITLVRWIENNIDHSKTKVIFLAPIPDHGSILPDYGWNRCQISSQSFDRISLHFKGYVKEPIYVLNVSSILLTAMEHFQSSSKSLAMDCDTWCLPGVPDTWNEMLYAMLLQIFGRPLVPYG